METETNGVAAWLMQIDRLTNLAVGQYELVHIVDQPEYTPIPQAPEYCKHVIIWNDNIVPVMNISSWVTGEVQPEDSGIVAILVYKSPQEEFLYGGIKLSNTPVLERVNNNQQCALPESLAKLKLISISCFKSSDGDVVPILDVTGLFSKKISA